MKKFFQRNQYLISTCIRLTFAAVLTYSIFSGRSWTILIIAGILAILDTMVMSVRPETSKD